MAIRSSWQSKLSFVGYPMGRHIPRCDHSRPARKARAVVKPFGESVDVTDVASNGDDVSSHPVLLVLLPYGHRTWRRKVDAALKASGLTFTCLDCPGPNGLWGNEVWFEVVGRTGGFRYLKATGLPVRWERAMTARVPVVSAGDTGGRALGPNDIPRMPRYSDSERGMVQQLADTGAYNSPVRKVGPGERQAETTTAAEREAERSLEDKASDYLRHHLGLSGSADDMRFIRDRIIAHYNDTGEFPTLAQLVSIPTE